MIEKKHLESFLKANGIAPTASDEEIRSVLISARWDHSEIDTALIVLRENMSNHETHVDTIHKVFNTDSRLNAAEINSLLGIKVSLSTEDIRTSLSDTRASVERTRMAAGFVLALVISGCSLGYIVYNEQSVKVPSAAHQSVEHGLLQIDQSSSSHK